MVRMEKSEKAYKILVGRSLGNHLLVRLRKKYERTLKQMLGEHVVRMGGG
jgi:hypothetical protein